MSEPNHIPEQPQAAMIRMVSDIFHLQPGDEKAFAKRLAAAINVLAANDMNSLLQLLYRLDVSEKKIREVLDVPSGLTAGELIAPLIMERELQKAEARNAFRAREDIPEDEKW